MQLHFTINIDERLVKAVKTFFKRRSVIITMICVIVSTLLIVYAADMDKTNSIQFQPDTLIKSSELNSKFNYIYSVLQTGGVDLVGFVMPYYGDPSDAPSGWEVCDGAQRTVGDDGEYQVLCSRIKQSSCSAGDTFNLPNLQGRVIAGVDPTGSTLIGMNEPNKIKGSADIELAASQLPSHVHKYTDKVRKLDAVAEADVHCVTFDSCGNNPLPGNGQFQVAPYIAPDENAYTAISETPYTEDSIFYFEYDGNGDIVDQTGEGTIDSNDILEVTTRAPVSVVQPTIALYYMIRTQ